MAAVLFCTKPLWLQNLQKDNWLDSSQHHTRAMYRNLSSFVWKKFDCELIDMDPSNSSKSMEKEMKIVVVVVSMPTLMMRTL